MTDEPEKREHPVLRADENPATRCIARAFEQARDLLRFLELVEQPADAFEVLGGGASIRFAWPRTISTGRRA